MMRVWEGGKHGTDDEQYKRRGRKRRRRRRRRRRGMRRIVRVRSRRRVWRSR
jgi:hypothetical protein